MLDYKVVFHSLLFVSVSPSIVYVLFNCCHVYASLILWYTLVCYFTFIFLILILPSSYSLISPHSFLSPIVPPAIPIFHSVSTTPFQASILLNHTNLTADDAPDEIVLTLIDQHGSLINTVTIPGHHTQHTFIGLTPSTQYTVSISVSNIDNEMDGDSVTLTTTTTGQYHILCDQQIIWNCTCIYVLKVLHKILIFIALLHTALFTSLLASTVCMNHSLLNVSKY